MEKNGRWDGRNRPKRCETRRLGLRFFFFFQFIVYNIANHIYYCFNLTSTTTTTTHQVVASPTTNDNTMMKTIPNTTSIHRVIDSLAGYMTMSDGPY